MAPPRRWPWTLAGRSRREPDRPPHLGRYPAESPGDRKFRVHHLLKVRSEEESMGRKLLLCGVVLLGLGACSVPGQITYKYVNNKWEPDTATFARDNVSASDIKSMQDRLNNK